MDQRLAAVAAPSGDPYDDPDMGSSDRGNAMAMQRMDSAVSDAYGNLDEGATTSLLNRNPITALQVRISFLVLWRKVPKFPEMNLCIS